MAWCSGLNDCDSCMNASASVLGCTWCRSDPYDPSTGSCHTQYSPYTSALQCGFSCHNLSNCTRTEPEYFGYAKADNSVVIGAIIFAVMSWCCCGCIFSCWVAMFENERDEVAAAAPQYHEMTELDADGAQTGTQQASSNNEANAQSGRLWHVKARERMPSCMRCCCGASAAFVFLFMVLLSLYYPQYPKYNICYQKDDWDSMFGILVRAIERGELSWTHKMLVSVYNPNRLGMEVTAVSAQFLHNGVLVGNWDFEDEFEMRAGSVQDLFVTMTFHPSLYQAESLLSDADYNTLKFTVVSEFAGVVKVGDLDLFRMKSIKQTQVIKIGSDKGRALCKCPAGWAFFD